jgi:hypothetical protein
MTASTAVSNFEHPKAKSYRLCGLVVRVLVYRPRVLVYRPRVLVFDSRRYKMF